MLIEYKRAGTARRTLFYAALSERKIQELSADKQKGGEKSKGGRLQLIKSVLTSIPIYLMTSFLLPRWVVNRIEQMCRNFLWGKMQGQQGIHLVNWELLCFPVSHGGLGIPNLSIRNLSLLLRWWWKLYCDKGNLWASVVLPIRCLSPNTEGPAIWRANFSFFWNQLVKIKPIFHWCAQWVVGNGKPVSYWYDSWNRPPVREIKNDGPRPPLQFISLRDMITCWPWILPFPDHEIPDFTDEDDQLLWRWSSDGVYSSNSIYKVMLTGGKIKWSYKIIWRSYGPAKVKFFSYLCLHLKILTHDSMLKRGIYCQMECALCQDCPLETAYHVLFQCRYATEVWDCMGMFIVKAGSIEETWVQSWTAFKQVVNENKRIWTTRFMTVMWGIWKQRNENIFRGKRTHPELLAARIREETEL